jgi:simple sugar transport system permease protein
MSAVAPLPGPAEYKPTVVGVATAEVVDPRVARIAWAAVALAALAFFVTIPPIALRTPVPSLLLGLVAAGAGAWAARSGARRLGWSAVAAAVLAVVCAWVTASADEAKLDQVVVWSALFAATLRFATPLIFAALGGIVSERAGVIALGLEGMMLSGALAAVIGADVTGSWLLGVLIGALGGVLVAAVYAVLAISLRADQVVAGTALNLIALGVTGYVFVARYGDQGSPQDLSRVPDLSLPGLGGDGFVAASIGSASLMTWIALVAVVGVAALLFRTTGGLHLRAVGERPDAAESAGIPVQRTRYMAVLASGALAGLGGAYLSLALLSSFSQNMTAGRGFIALAAVIFGRWRPGGALAAALLFGFSSAIARRLPAFSDQLATLFQALPYVLTLVAVAGLVGRSRAAGSLGRPYERG